MKHFTILTLLLFYVANCSSQKGDDWSSGSQAGSAYQEQQYQEQTESVRKQTPEARPNF